MKKKVDEIKDNFTKEGLGEWRIGEQRLVVKSGKV